ncbi:MAG TPA: transposase [Actinobacteria bacterium]|nr:transposase [Actinomycetota bacterium]
MRVTYKYKMYHSKNNKHLHQTINLAGRAYNHGIALRRRYYKLTRKHLRQYALIKHFAKLVPTCNFEVNNSMVLIDPEYVD